MKYLPLFAFILALVPFSKSLAQVETYEFDQPHTQVLFFVDHLGFSKSQGEFEQVDGIFTIDRDNPQNSTIDITIPIRSLDMDDEKWEEHLFSADFFDVDKYPVMTFKSTDVQVSQNENAIIRGDLTLKGVTKPVILNVKHNKSDIHPKSEKMVAGFSGSAALKRSDFGMSYGLPGVGDTVEIRLEVEGNQITEDE